jgi:hypothetical protein
MKLNVILIALLFIIVFLVLYIYYSYNNGVYYKDYGDPSSSIKVCLITGVHGNEPAGSILFNNLIESGYFERVAEMKGIFIRVLPNVNEFGLDFGLRHQNNVFHPDINRTFEEGGMDVMSKDIIRLIKNMTLIIDFHEGWGFHRLNKKSIGSTLTVTDNVKKLANVIVTELNRTIPEDYKKFTILDRMCSIKTALSCYANNMGKQYILVETTGQENIQPLEIRHSQIQTILDVTFSHI